MGTPAALDIVAMLIDSIDVKIRHEATLALARNKDARALNLFKTLLPSEGESYSAWAAMGWLTNFPAKDVLPIYIDGLRHPLERIRRTSFNELQQYSHHSFGYDSRLEPSAQSSAIERWDVWWNEAKSQERYDILADTIRTEDSYTASQACRLLLELGDRRAIPILYKIPAETIAGGSGATAGERVRRAALQRLIAEGLPTNGDYLQWWRDHKDNVPPRSPLFAPLNPLPQVGKIQTEGAVRIVRIERDLLFVGGWTNFEVHDISNIKEPQMLGRYFVKEGVSDLLPRDGRLYVMTSQPGGLHVYSYTTQGDLEFISSHYEVKYSGRVYSEGNRLLSGNEMDGAALYDVAAPGPPRLLDSKRWADIRRFSFASQGEFFTFAQWNRDAISTEGVFPITTVRLTHGGSVPMTGDGQRFYCLDDGLLKIYNWKNGNLLGTAPIRNPHQGELALDGDRLYALFEDMGLLVGGETDQLRLEKQCAIIEFDISNAAKIKILSHTPLLAPERNASYAGLAVTDEYLFCSNTHDEVIVFSRTKRR